MRRQRCLFAAVSVLAAVLVSACGGNDGPTSPSARIPNYAAAWSGTYTITGCNQTGGVALANICGSLGATPPYTFSLTQSSRNVSGSFALGSIQFPNTGGTIAQDGSLALSGTTVSSGITIVVNWALNMPAQAITGTITQQWTSDTLSGTVTVTGSINNAIRAASTTAAVSPQRTIRTPSDLATAVSGR
jgi:hypothetical protein